MILGAIWRPAINTGKYTYFATNARKTKIRPYYGPNSAPPGNMENKPTHDTNTQTTCPRAYCARTHEGGLQYRNTKRHATTRPANI